MTDSRGRVHDRPGHGALARPFDTLLIANRGEIACRVIRTARAMGLRTVAVYSDADRDALHVRLADSAAPLGPAPARESYLSIPKIMDACRATGAQAVHPGYGFLSENADFARACRDAGLIFVGPAPESIDALGNKSAAKRLAQRIGVPCLPGYSGAEQSPDTLLAEARAIGAPLMIKAAAGGGGRGMRRCDDVDDCDALRALIEAARAEAISSFGNGDLLLERLVEDTRHVEIQVFGDTLGNYVHLGERDCSTQRRNQKILEEAPAPGVDSELRARMGEAAITLAREVGYHGAGTIEFLLGADGGFYFLEMNTRLQVEHPVTEAITGLDLVGWQLMVARGDPLPFRQSEVAWRGHAIEARLCAEDAFGGFVPQIGRIRAWEVPEMPGVRLDHGLVDAPEVSPHYDSMIAKVIAYGEDRDEARRRLIRALNATSILGLRTNREYLVHCLAAQPFADARLSTRWLGEASPSWSAAAADERWVACAAALILHRAAQRFGPFANWTSVDERVTPMRLMVDGASHAVSLAYNADRPVTLSVGASRFAIQVIRGHGIDWELMIDGRHEAVRAWLDREQGWLDAFGVSAAIRDDSHRPPTRDKGGSGVILSAMHGALVKLAVQPGQRVDKGVFLLSIEAMKMEHRIEAPIAGTVVEIAVAAGAQVAPGRMLLRIEPDPPPPDA